MNVIESGRCYHMSVDVAGAIRNKAFSGCSQNGVPLTRKQAEAHFIILRMKGVKLLPLGECDNFDNENGCMGHAPEDFKS